MVQVEFTDDTILPLMGSLLIAVLGVAVLLIRPARKPQKAFAVYAIAFGLGSGVSRFGSPDSASAQTAIDATSALGIWVAAFGVAWLVWSLVRPSTSAKVAALVSLPPAAAAMAGWLLLLLAEAPMTELARALGDPFEASYGITWTSLVVFLAAAWAGAAVLSLAAVGDDERKMALLALALALSPAAFGAVFVFLDSAVARAFSLVTVAGVLWTSGVWLWRSRYMAEPRVARVAAWGPMIVLLVGMVGAVAAARYYVVVPGLARIATVLIIAYAILRHQALDIDAKLRFGISKGTIAAVFVIVFFIASETAQEFFGQTLQNEYIGIAAAGLLLLVLAPLRRVADRLAERAVPHAPSLAEREDRYRQVVERFLRDERLSADEERALAHLADDLGIPSGRAFDLREEVETSRRRGTSP